MNGPDPGAKEQAAARHSHEALAALLALLAFSLGVGTSEGCTQKMSQRAQEVESLPSRLADHHDSTPRLDWLVESDLPGVTVDVTAAEIPRLDPGRSGRGLISFTDPIWSRVHVKNNARTQSLSVLELGFTPNFAELYSEDGTKLVLLSRSGTSLPFAMRPVQSTRIAFPLTIPAGHSSTYLLRIQSNELFWPRARLWSVPGFARLSAARAIVQGLYYGLLLAMIIYNGFIYISTRERTYLLYVFFQGTNVLLQAALDQVAFQYLWPHAPKWAQSPTQLFGSVGFFFAIHFSLAFLELERYAPRLTRILTIMSLAALLLAALSGVGMQPVSAHLRGLFFLTCLLTIAGAGIVAAGEGQPNARFFLLGWTPLLCAAALSVLAGFGLFPNELADVTFKICSAAETMILALALANRINLMRRERESSAAELLMAKTAQSSLLEQRVADRTLELSQTLTRLKLTQDKLIRQERLSSLAGMVAGMAHEVGNPLNFAHGGAQILQERINDAAQTWQRLCARPLEAKGHVGHVEHVADAKSMSRLLAEAVRAVDLVSAGLQRIGKIMTNLRGYMQLREVEPRPTDLVAEIESTLLMVEDMLVRYGVTIVKHLAPLPPFPCRPGELNQVFMNIVLNACSAMNGQGVIVVSTRVDAAGCIEIRFTDTGPGVLPAHREAIFEPFFSAHAISGSSTGLGLYLAREIVTRHGGQLTLLDNPCGACFVLRLPSEAEAVPRPRAHTV